MAEMRKYVEQPLLDALDTDPMIRYNIVVCDGHLSGIIEWEDSGWCM